MKQYTQLELKQALTVINSLIQRCENAQVKFVEGTSHYSLLKNRLQALYLSKNLITQPEEKHDSKDALESALPPILSIIHKTTKAQSKYPKDSSQYQRFTPTITTMELAKDLIETELNVVQE